MSRYLNLAPGGGEKCLDSLKTCMHSHPPPPPYYLSIYELLLIRSSRFTLKMWAQSDEFVLPERAR